MSTAQESKNLDRLVKAGIITRKGADTLSSAKVQKIERLTNIEIAVLLRVHKKVGRVEGCGII